MGDGEAMIAGCLLSWSSVLCCWGVDLSVESVAADGLLDKFSFCSMSSSKFGIRRDVDWSDILLVPELLLRKLGRVRWIDPASKRSC